MRQQQQQQTNSYPKRTHKIKEELQQTPNVPKTPRTKPIKKQTISTDSHAGPLAPSSSTSNLPTLQSVLAIPKEQRASQASLLIKQLHPFMLGYMQRKQGSRVLQLLYKWADATVGAEIVKLIQKNWKQLIRSKYALYTISKVVQDHPLEQILPSWAQLQTTFEGAAIVEIHLETHCKPVLASIGSNKQYITPHNTILDPIRSAALKMHMESQLKDADPMLSETLDNLCLKSIEKHYETKKLSKFILSLRLPLMFDEEREKAQEHLLGQIAGLVGDDDGVRLFFTLVNMATPKQKKILVKEYRGHVQEILTNENTSYVSLIKLITDCDDTVFISGSLLEEVQTLLLTHIKDNHKLNKLILALLTEKTNCFNIVGKYEPNSHSTTCKKPIEMRMKQLRADLYDALIPAVLKQLSTLARDRINNRVVVALYKALDEDKHPKRQQYVRGILDFYLSQLQSPSIPLNATLTCDPIANKILKNILFMTDSFVQPYISKVGQLLVAKFNDLAYTKGSFVLLGLLEKGNSPQLVKEVKKKQVDWQKVIGGQHYLKLWK